MFNNTHAFTMLHPATDADEMEHRWIAVGNLQRKTSTPLFKSSCPWSLPCEHSVHWRAGCTAVDEAGHITYCQTPDISIERSCFGCLCLTIWTKMFYARFSAWGWVLLEALQGKNILLCQKAELEEGNALLFPHYQNSLINPTGIYFTTVLLSTCKVLQLIRCLGLCDYGKKTPGWWKLLWNRCVWVKQVSVLCFCFSGAIPS